MLRYQIREMTMQNALDYLTDELNEWCDANSRPHQCALELYHAAMAHEWPETQIEWLKDYNRRWEQAEQDGLL